VLTNAVLGVHEKPSSIIIEGATKAVRGLTHRVCLRSAPGTTWGRLNGVTETLVTIVVCVAVVISLIGRGSVKA
jgi:hypothetical protein